MRKFVLLAALLAMLLVAALPALAADDRGDGDRNDNNNHRDHNNRNDNNNHRDHNNRNNSDGDPVITQENEQETESGDVDQAFNVSNTGDNSNQCVGLQGVANTGNAQNQTSLIQYGSEADDFEFDEVGSTITVSPENSTTCDQQVNQAASASGDNPGTGGYPVKKK
jgi:Ni/Co efflux regulator RcnB